MPNQKISALSQDTGSLTDHIVVAEGTSANKKVLLSAIQTLLGDLLADTSPQLGGALDVNGKQIQSISTTDIELHSDRDVKVTLGDAAGADALEIYDSSDGLVAKIDSDGTIYTNNGSTSEPAHSFTTDIDTGMYKPADAEIGLVTGGARVQHTKLAQTDLGDGVAQHGLYVQRGDSTAKIPFIELDSSDDTARFLFVDDAGNLRIHTSIPTADGDGSILNVTGANVTTAGALMDSEVASLAAIKDVILTAGLTIAANWEVADETKFDAIEALADVTDATNVTAAGALMDSEVASLAAIKDVVLTAGLTIAANWEAADETKFDAIEALADVTDATNVNAAGAAMNTDWDANTILAANSDDTPLALTVAASRIVGRKSSGNIVALTAAELLAIIGGTPSEWSGQQNFNGVTLTGLGADLVTNGGFATDTSWTKGTGWTIPTPVADQDNAGGDSDLTQALSLVNGSTYQVKFEVKAYTDGNVTAVAGDTEGTDRASAAIFTENIVAGAGGDIDIRADSTFTGQVDDVSVKLANVSWNLNTQQVATLTLDGDLVPDNPTNMKDGATYVLTLIQDGTGTRLLTYGSAYEFPAGTAPVLSTGVTDVDILTFKCNGTKMRGNILKNFS